MPATEAVASHVDLQQFVPHLRGQCHRLCLVSVLCQRTVLSLQRLGRRRRKLRGRPVRLQSGQAGRKVGLSRGSLLRPALSLAVLAPQGLQKSGGGMLRAPLEDWMPVQAAPSHPREEIIGLESGFLVRE